MIDAGEVCGVLLAAGLSRRFGRDDKLLAGVDGDPLVLHAARNIVDLSVGRRVAVCNDGSGGVAALLAPLGFEIVTNLDPARGLSSSLAAGIAEAARGAEAAALVCLADMPFVSLAHLRALLAQFDPENAPMVASARGDVTTPPAVFARTFFESLQATEGDRGAKQLLAGATRVQASPDELADIDLPSDLPA